jgi:5-methyltetrahydrofolate--homocysteine methyltransferase
MIQIEVIKNSLVSGNGPQVRDLTKQALDEGFAAGEILQRALMSGMDEVGRRMKAGECFLPEVLLSARAMKMALEVLGPRLAVYEVGQAGRIVLGTVKGDLHDIGKNLVGMMLEGAGFDVIDLGTDVAPEKFVESLADNEADLLGMSCLLTTTMPMMKSTIEVVDEAGLRDRIKVMVGGAVITQAYADQIGADGHAPDAASAVDKARELMGQEGIE